MKEEGRPGPMPQSDLYVLLALCEGPLYGYALKKEVARVSRGAVAPEVGSLYRILGRLMTRGFVEETESPEEEAQTHPGKKRKYYRVTPHGEGAARFEASRLRDLVALAMARNILPDGGGTR